MKPFCKILRKHLVKDLSNTISECTGLTVVEQNWPFLISSLNVASAYLYAQ